MRTCKIMILTTLVAGLLFMTATAAMAGYTGLYTSSGQPNVTLGADYFQVNTSNYTVNSDGNLWSANGAGGYFYGATLDSSTLSGYLGDLPDNLTSGLDIPSNLFGFVQSSYAFDETTLNAINGSVTGFISTSLIAIEAFRASAFWAKVIYGGTLEEVLSGYASELLSSLSGYDLSDAEIGYGFFYDEGNKFDVSLGSLDEEGLVALFNNANVNTYEKAATPIPGALWLLGSGLIGLVGIRRRMKS